MEIVSIIHVIVIKIMPKVIIITGYVAISEVTQRTCGRARLFEFSMLTLTTVVSVTDDSERSNDQKNSQFFENNDRDHITLNYNSNHNVILKLASNCNLNLLVDSGAIVICLNRYCNGRPTH